MSIATANLTALYYVEETVIGTTPATPTLTPIRYTSEGLNYNLENITSNEIRSDRQISDLVQVSADASGNIDGELSYGTWDTFFLHAFHDAAWSTLVAVSETDIDAAAGDNSLNTAAGDFTTENLFVGQWISVNGFSTNPASFFARIESITAAKLVVSGVTLLTEAAGATITMDSALLVNGTTEKAMSIQKHFQDSTVDEYITFTGCRNDGFTLSLNVGEIVTVSFDILAYAASGSSSQIAGATVNPASTTQVMNAVGNVADVWIDGAASTACLNSLNISLANGLRGIECIGTLGYTDVVSGTLSVTGSVEIYFEDRTEWDKFVAATGFSLAVGIEDAAGNGYILSLDNVKYVTGVVVSGGLDTDIVFAADFQGILSSDTGKTISLSRFAA